MKKQINLKKSRITFEIKKTTLKEKILAIAFLIIIILIIGLFKK
nr:MAG TPA: hypothetical protein [Caudoviricetes sp.]